MGTTWLVLMEWSAVGLGLTGSVLWAMNKTPLLVAILWSLSAVLWMGFAYFHNHNGLMVRDLVGLLIYLKGISTYAKVYFNKPLVEAGVESVS